ncbi:MAG: hypothetical protein Q4D80_05605 [Pseudomonadota bacterium]|nr:hypothetical protein [Pseudomonadota bacterium]
MKFAATLIKIFCGGLSAFFFGAFLYYTYQYQLTQESSNLMIANIALIIFLVSSLIFALLFIIFDAYQNRNLSDLLAKALQNTGSKLQEDNGNTNVVDLLSHISSYNNQINLQLQSLNNGLNSINDAAAANSANLQNSFNQLSEICGKISHYVDSIKNENQKENERNAGRTGDLAVLISTVSRLSSDINNLNGRLLDVVNQISQNITTSIHSHTNIDNEIKGLLQKIISSKDTISDNNNTVDVPATDTSVIPQSPEDILAESDTSSDLQSVADFYEQRTGTITAEESDFSPEPENITIDNDVRQKNEERIEELLTAPKTDISVDEPLSDRNEPQEKILPETITEPEIPVQNQPNNDEPLPAESFNDGQKFTASELSEQFDTPAEPQQNDIYSDFAAAYTAAEADIPAASEIPADAFSIEASDPFNPPADYLAEKSVNDAPVSLDIPEENTTHDKAVLDNIFDDKFAAEISDLDILKDDKDISAADTLSVEDLLADTNTRTPSA